VGGGRGGRAGPSPSSRTPYPAPSTEAAGSEPEAKPLTHTHARGDHGRHGRAYPVVPGVVEDVGPALVEDDRAVALRREVSAGCRA
jgi:hypothetical protein